MSNEPQPSRDEREGALKGQVAVVTGGGSGLGRSHALLLASRGAHVVVNDLGAAVDGSGQSAGRADEVVAEIVRRGGVAVAEHSSVATREGGEHLAKLALEEFGRIDIVVNNAGNIEMSSFAKLDLETIDKVLDVHLRGAFYVTQPCYREMVRQEYGRIIFTVSGVGLFGNGGVSTYGAAKGGVFGLMQVLRLEGQRHNIKVNAIAPMATTRMSIDLELPQYDQVEEEEITSDLVSPVVGYFSSPECEVNGEVWSVGAGSVAKLFIGRSPGYFKHPRLEGPLTVEDIASNVDAIQDLEGFVVPTSWPDEWALVVERLRGPKNSDAL